MTRGQLPKAFLRVDPDIDQKHPDNLEGFVRLLCAANRQVPRGRFTSRVVLDRLFGKSAVDRLSHRGDLQLEADGSVTVPGWHVWQEGDHTVAERMRRYRQGKGGISDEPSPTVTEGVTPTVTEAVTVASPASEASRRLGVSPSSDEEVVRGKPRPPSERQRVFAWLADHGLTKPSGYVLTDLDGVIKGTSADAVIDSFEEALANRSAITTKNYVKWAEQSLTPPPVSANQSAKPAGHHGNAREIRDAFQS